ncbi:hypothetical protein BH09BAC6_BH09BAC6_18010 [soil metagenome]|jgi:hypothetical protein
MKYNYHFKCILILTLICLHGPTFAQTPPNPRYAILTFERSPSNHYHGMQSYYWIIAVDSIKASGFPMYPLLPEVFSTNDLERCKQHKVVNIFVMDSGSNYLLTGDQIKDEQLLKKILKRHRRELQKFNRKISVYPDSVKVFVTPITGTFCECPIYYPQSGKEINYDGLISLPISQFKFDRSFYNTTQFKQVRSFDFSKKYYITRPLYQTN